MQHFLQDILFQVRLKSQKKKKAKNKKQTNKKSNYFGFQHVSRKVILFLSHEVSPILNYFPFINRPSVFLPKKRNDNDLNTKKKDAYSNGKNPQFLVSVEPIKLTLIKQLKDGILFSWKILCLLKCSFPNTYNCRDSDFFFPSFYYKLC